MMYNNGGSVFAALSAVPMQLLGYWWVIIADGILDVGIGTLWRMLWPSTVDGSLASMISDGLYVGVLDTAKFLLWDAKHMG